jgi:hypothetical protein
MHADPSDVYARTHQLALITSTEWEGSIEVCVSPPGNERLAIARAAAKANRSHGCDLSVSALTQIKRNGGASIEWGVCFTPRPRGDKQTPDGTLDHAGELPESADIIPTSSVVGRVCEVCASFVEGEDNRQCPACKDDPDTTKHPLEEWYRQAEPVDP